MKSNKITRQIVLINLLVNKPDGLHKNDIEESMERAFEGFKYLKSTFERDKKEIKNDFGIELQYEKGIYYISDWLINDSKVELLLNSFKIFSSLIHSSGLPPHIIPENRKASGIDNFAIISEAIGKKRKVTFDYIKFENQNKTNRTIKPLALKESRGRWYLIGQEENSSQLKSFGLDRISNVFEKDQTFKKNENVISEINEYYKDSFAMFRDNEAEIVKLSFDLRDGKYIKSFPIHSSQEVTEDLENQRCFVTLNIRITYDFIMELLSRSQTLEVIEPLHLRKKIASIFQEALDRNI